ncbi:MAG: hypothetical protein Q4A92_05825 [Corynebacterium sp.]|nr:hypothetical protein [Corynebacterium sp.]
MTHSKRQSVIFGNYVTWTLAGAPMTYFAILFLRNLDTSGGFADWVYDTIFPGGPGVLTSWILIILYILTPIAASWCVITGFQIRRAVLCSSRTQSLFWLTFGATAMLLLLWVCTLVFGPLFLFNTYTTASTLL